MERTAVLLSLPSTRAEYLGATQGKYCHDYIKRVVGGLHIERVWDEHYKVICTAANSLIETAERLGVSLFRRATLEDLRAASARHETLIIFAHWKGANVDPGDLALDPHSVSLLEESEEEEDVFSNSSLDDLNYFILRGVHL